MAAAGFTPVLPPVLVRGEAMIGAGFFPTEKSNIYELETGRPLPHRHVRGRARGDALTESSSATSYHCARGVLDRFRREGGAAARTPECSGCISSTSRMFVFTTATDAWAEHDRMVALENLLAQLGLPTASSTSSG